MLKLWIVHRSPQQRASLARLGGLPHSEFVAGPPAGDEFDGAARPAAIVMGLEGDFEQELEFAHRHRRQLAGSHWLLLCASEDAEEAARLFATVEPEIVVNAPTARVLRALVSRAVAHRRAASLAEREKRERLAERFSVWLGGVEVPGLLRALDPSLSRLPLIVRGRPGSGRSLLGHYLELYRGSGGSLLRLNGRDLRAPSDIERRLADAAREHDRPFETVWIDDIDLLPASAQHAVAEWIVHGSGIAEPQTGAPRWIATAGPESLDDRLEPALEQAFAPLRLEVPALTDHPETFAAFAEEISRDWTRSVGGVPRRFTGDALESLAAHPWSGDRAEVEAVLRTTLAASSRETIDETDLRFPSDPGAIESEEESTGATRPIEAIRALMEEPEVEAREESSEESATLPSAVFEDAMNEPSVETPEGGLLGDPTFPAGDVDESTKLAEAAFGLATPEAPEATKFESETAEAESPTGSRPIEATQGWRRLARSLSHEIRNPLVSIRTFAELLPEHFDDETFRARFTELVGKDVAHISDVLTRLSGIAERETIESESVDVSALIEALLEERRERITRGRLLVLRELERDAPLARADAKGLEIALAGLLDRALESLPVRGDLFVATRRLERGSDGQPRLRILLRHHNPTLESAGEVVLGELEPTANLLEYVLAEAVVEGSGGTLTIDATDAGETLILVDLRTPA